MARFSTNLKSPNRPKPPALLRRSHLSASRAAPKAVKDVYFAGLPGDTGLVLSIAGWGWHAETGLHSLRLIVSGLFDRFSELQVIIGHMRRRCPLRSGSFQPVAETALWPET